jgi:amino acid permease
VRRFWIHTLLPLAFAAIPVMAAALLLAAIPSNALQLYLSRVATSPIDWIIIALGLSLFVVQIGMSWKALRWQESDGDFDHRADRWVNHLSQAAEWFPLLGLIGTVVAILLTFSAIQPDRNPPASEIIQNYAPAITATGGGLYMAFINILPYWIVGAGRDLIRTFGGYASPLEPKAGEKK